MKAELEEIFMKVLHLSQPLKDYTREELPIWDSMKHVELIIEIQKLFGIRFSVNEILKINKLSDFEQLIEDSE